MALTLGVQVGAHETSIVLTLDAQTAEAGWLRDQFYVSSKRLSAEPDESLAKATLTTTGNGSVELTGLEPGNLYWVQAWRHFEDLHTEESTAAPLASYDRLWPYYTLGWSAPKLQVASPWVETWDNDLSQWVDEYPMSACYNHVTVLPDDGLMGSRFARFDAQGPMPLITRQAWDPTQPFEARCKTRVSQGSPYYPTWNAWRPLLVVLESEGGYIQGSTDNNGMFWAYGWGSQQHNGNLGTPAYGSIHEYKITYDGAGTWRYYVDDVLKSTIANYSPKGPLHLWWNSAGILDVGAITVVGTPYLYAAGDNGQNKYWEGTFSVREGNDISGGTWDADYGGITAPNLLGRPISMCAGYDGQHSSSLGSLYPASTYAAGAFNAKSPVIRAGTYRTAQYNGTQANGSFTLTIRRAADDSVAFGPYTPANAETVTVDISSLGAFEEIYFDVQGTVTTQGSTASILHFVAIDGDLAAHVLPVQLLAENPQLPVQLLAEEEQQATPQLPVQLLAEEEQQATPQLPVQLLAEEEQQATPQLPVQLLAEEEPTGYNAASRQITGTVEIYFDGLANDPTVVTCNNYLVDLTALLELGSDNSSNPLGSVSANELTFTLANIGNIFTATNSASPFYGKIKTGVAVKCYINLLGQQQVAIGTFYVTSWTARLGDSIAAVVCADETHNLFEAPVPTLDICSGYSFNELLSYVLTAYGYSATIDAALTDEVLYYVPGASSTGPLLKELLEAAMAYLVVDATGELVVRKFEVGQIVETLTDADQVIDVNNAQSTLDAYDGVAVQYALPQISESREVLSFTAAIPAGETDSEYTAFAAPVYCVSAVSVRSVDNGVAVSGYVSDNVGITVTTDASSQCDAAIIVTGKSLEFVQQEIGSSGNNALTVSNNCIQTAEYAAAYRDTLAAIVSTPNLLLEVVIRGNPTIQLGDTVRVLSSTYGLDYVGIVKRMQYRYDGGLSCVMTLLNAEAL